MKVVGPGTVAVNITELTGPLPDLRSRALNSAGPVSSSRILLTTKRSDHSGLTRYRLERHWSEVGRDRLRQYRLAGDGRETFVRLVFTRGGWDGCTR